MKNRKMRIAVYNLQCICIMYIHIQQSMIKLKFVLRILFNISLYDISTILVIVVL